MTALTEGHPDARDGAFTRAGAEKKFCWLHALRQRRGLLGRVRMSVADVDAETPELDVAHPVVASMPRTARSINVPGTSHEPATRLVGGRGKPE